MTAANPVDAVRLDNVSHSFGRRSHTVHVLRDASIAVAPGELVAISGASGAGKTTLLNIISGLDMPRSGRVTVAGHDMTAAAESERVRLRRTTIGCVLQTLGLIPILSAAENIGIPLRLAAVPAAERDRRVAELLDRVGLGDHAHQRPDELSGGQQQRVAVARAMIGNPRLLLADEPTGQLDTENSRQMAELLRTEIRQTGTAAVITTYDPVLLEIADRHLVLRDGQLTEDRPGRSSVEVRARKYLTR